MPKVKRNITVNAPVDLVYRAWHNFENFPAFMSNIEEVRVVSGGRSHWRAKGALGRDAEWDAEITLDEPNQAIGWRSIDGNASVKTAGRVNFREAGPSTELDVTIEYDPPAGVVGDVVTQIFADPERRVGEDLNRFKEVIERGQELSGLRFDGYDSSEKLGGSMGGATSEDLEQIANTNSGVTPTGVDDPATRA